MLWTIILLTDIMVGQRVAHLFLDEVVLDLPVRHCTNDEYDGCVGRHRRGEVSHLDTLLGLVAEACTHAAHRHISKPNTSKHYYIIELKHNNVLMY